MTRKTLLWLTLIFLTWGCDFCELSGSHVLGNRLTLLEGDRLSDRVIVFCSNDDGCCKGGMPIIPSSDDNETRYVEKASFNERYVIAKAMNKNDSYSYWIINKAFEDIRTNCDNFDCKRIVDSNTIGPMSIGDFNRKIDELNIGLSFD